MDVVLSFLTGNYKIPELNWRKLFMICLLHFGQFVSQVWLNAQLDAQLRYIKRLLL